MTGNPLWYKDAVIYQLHVRAYADSNGDGIGDFRGLASRLDYLRDLGVNTLWLLPFYPSPLRDDGYDIADYGGVHPNYGTLADFRQFLREAHRRGLRVVTELVLNHTSDRHAWFQRARKSPPGTRHRDFYVWSDSPDRYAEARIIFKDFETSNWTWDARAKAYFWHRFYSHQPDLNFENPAVHKALLKVLDGWFDMGVDGVRLDAVPYLYEREGTSCENLEETHAFLRKLRRHLEGRHRDRMLLAEANQWPEDAVAYFGDGDECHMAFHFPVMPRMFMALHMEDRFPIVDILDQTPGIPDGCQWGLFLRNHDELTLEMVTDEERDYMYRVYAHDPQARINLGIRRRLAPLLRNNRRKFELLHGLLLSLPGTPILYYGDEIGMGDNIYLGDRNGVRTPMQWSGDRNAGFSRANPQKLYLPVIIDPEYHYEAVNVETQLDNPNSLLWWMRRLIHLRRRFKAFGRGSIRFLSPENRKVLSFLRRWEGEEILVVANLSRFTQYVELDLSEFKGRVPVELFGQSDFPPIGELPYLMTLGPHGFAWFSLETRREEFAVAPAPTAAVPEVEVSGTWKAVFGGKAEERLGEAIAAFLPRRRWFGGKTRRLKGVVVADSVPLALPGVDAVLVLAEADFVEGEKQTYALVLSFAEQGADPVCRLRVTGKNGEVAREGILVEAMQDPALGSALLDAVGRRRRLKGARGRLSAVPTAAFRRLRGEAGAPLPVVPLRGEQSNTSIIFGDRLVLKLIRRVEEGVNPDLEVGRFLTERARFQGSPPVAGFLEYRRDGGKDATLGIFAGFVANQGDAWSYTLDELGRFFERAGTVGPLPPRTGERLMERIDLEPPAEVRERVGGYLETARTLGLRTAEMHAALASDEDDPDFVPEKSTPFYVRSVYQSMRNQVTAVLPLLERGIGSLRGAVKAEARDVLDRKSAIMDLFKGLLGGRLRFLRIRTHGDYHLGQVLYTGRDFVIVDFEGEPARALSERRLKRSPLRDVAGMLRSFHYAAHTALLDQAARRGSEVAGGEESEAARLWSRWVASAFLRAYLGCAEAAGIVPADREAVSVLLSAFLMEKAVYELGYELNNRPTWVRVPLRGILEVLEEDV